MSSYQWWPEPRNIEDVNPYLDNLFRYAGDNLWTKILRPYLSQEFQQDLAPPPPPVEVGQGTEPSKKTEK